MNSYKKKKDSIFVINFTGFSIHLSHLIVMTEDQEQNTFGRRIKRYARVSSKMAGLGARLAGERYLGLKIEREDHARDLKEALGNLKGPLMKVAQLLSSIPDALPQEYVQELGQLQANAPSMGWPFVKRRMAAELGAGWQKKFASFERNSASAASLGQVHIAHDHDGRKLACKLQYPDMLSAVEADLKQLRVILSLYERYDNAVKTHHIHAELAERLHEELDYEREALHMKMYKDILKDEAHVHVPDVVDDLSSTRLLSMSWLDGAPLMSFQDAPLEMRNTIAMNMFHAWYVPLYYYGVIHGDPHLGNYTIRENGDINLLDFGCIRVFPPKFIQGVIDLYRAVQNQDKDLARHAYDTWGFSNLNDDVVDVLNIWAQFIYAPVIDDKTRLMGETNNGVYGRETAREVHLKLKEVGGVEVPREFVFMDRAALGLGSVFLHLKAELNWHRMFEDLVSKFDQKAVEDRQAAMLQKHNLLDGA